MSTSPLAESDALPGCTDQRARPRRLHAWSWRPASPACATRASMPSPSASRPRASPCSPLTIAASARAAASHGSWSGQTCSAMTGAPPCALRARWIGSTSAASQSGASPPAAGHVQLLALTEVRDRGGDLRRSARRRCSHPALHRRPSPPHPPRPGGDPGRIARSARRRGLPHTRRRTAGLGCRDKQPGRAQRLRINHAAGFELAQRSLRPYLHGAAIPVEPEDPSHPDPDPLLHHRG